MTDEDWQIGEPCEGCGDDSVLVTETLGGVFLCDGCIYIQYGFSVAEIDREISIFTKEPKVMV